MDPLIPHHLDDDAPGGIVINPHSELGKALRKWEQHRTELVPRGTNPGNPYVFRPYPRMLYKAQRLPGGQVSCMMPAPNLYEFDRADAYERASLFKESFDRSCQRIVKDEAEERIAVGQGWAFTPTAALELHEQQEQAIGNAAAEAAFVAQRMTSQAKRELAIAETQTHEHVTDVVGASKKTRGRPKRVKPVSAAVVEGDA